MTTTLVSTAAWNGTFCPTAPNTRYIGLRGWINSIYSQKLISGLTAPILNLIELTSDLGALQASINYIHDP